jgi:putative oxidoreductase
MLSIMLVASVTVHWKNGLFASANGIEIPLLYGTAAVGLALAGPGRWSLDALLGLLPLWTPGLIGGAIGIGVLGALVNLAFRRRSPSHQA